MDQACSDVAAIRWVSRWLIFLRREYRFANRLTSFTVRWSMGDSPR